MRSEPAAISIILASNVHRISAPYPNLAMTLNTTGMNAAVGPPICTREPPSPRMTTPGFIFSQTATQGSSQEVRTEPDSARRVRPHLRCAAEAARRGAEGSRHPGLAHGPPAQALLPEGALAQAAREPAQGDVILRRLVVQPLQHSGGADERVGRCRVQFGPPDYCLALQSD